MKECTKLTHLCGIKYQFIKHPSTEKWGREREKKTAFARKKKKKKISPGYF